MGRNYASPNLHKTLITYDWYTISREGFMQNAKIVGTLPLVVIDYESHYNFHVHCSSEPLIICDFCINPPLIYRQNCYFNWRIYAKHKKSGHLAISLQLTMNLITTVSVTAASKPLIICDFCINPPLIYRQNCWFNGRFMQKHKKSRYLVINYKSHYFLNCKLYEVL